jgi:UDP-N-acetylmuramate dehydrogenase
MGGRARWLCEPGTLAEIKDVVAFARAAGLPLAVLGSGSNSVCSDLPFEGVVLALGSLRRWHWLGVDGQGRARLWCEAGVTNTEVSEACLDRGVAGGHWMYRMPGLLGASVRMNARCYGGEVSQIVESVTTLDVEGRLRTRGAAEVFKGYKSTSLMAVPEIVVSCVLALGPGSPREELLAGMETCEADRHRKHHFDHPSCGSTFKNNYTVGRPSGAVFDSLGLKGTRVGNVAVSEHHANFVWNLGAGCANDMLTLAAFMRERALAAGADLELEVQPVGRFGADLFARCAMERLGPNVREADGSHNVGLTWHPRGLETRGPETRGLETRGPETRGLETRGPETRGLETRGLETRGLETRGLETRGLETRGPETPDSTLPRVMFHLLPEEYFRTPDSGLTGVEVVLSQLVSVEEARARPKAPFLAWETRVSADALASTFSVRPDAPAGAFVDDLWTASVSELFLAHPAWRDGHESAYLEFESTPEGHWIALAFEGTRRRAAGQETPSAAHWKGVEKTRHVEGDGTLVFGMTLAWSVVESVVSFTRAGSFEVASILAQGALSLGGSRYFLAPHWAREERETWCFARRPTAKPDFHQPARYLSFPLLVGNSPAREDADMEARVIAFVALKAREILGARRVLLFGSRARGDATRTSDYDFAIEAADASGWGRFRGEVDEEAPTLNAIDLVDLGSSLRPEFREEIERTGIDVKSVGEPTT